MSGRPFEGLTNISASAPKPTWLVAVSGPRSSVDVRVSWQTWLTGVVLFIVFVSFLSVVQFATPSLAGNDGYYHIKLAYLMRTEGLRSDFQWLPLTVLNAEEFVDHHFLFHVLLIPFTLGDLRLGAKLASVIYPALTFLAAWWLLRGQRVPLAALWSLGLLVVSEAFIYRMSMPRAQSLSLAVLILALHWLLTRRYHLLLPLAFLYVWLYDAFPLILILAAIYAGACWLIERHLPWQPLAYAGVGVGLGLIINPYFPDNLAFVYRHIGPKLFDPTATKVGSEWYPYNTTQLMENSGLALVAFLAGVLALWLHNRRMDARTATSLFLAILFGAMLLQSRRFVEYFPAFALIFAALAWAPLLQRWLHGRAKDPDTGLPLSQAVTNLQSEGPVDTRRLWVAGVVALIALLPALWLNLQASRDSLQASKPYHRYAEAAAWLQDNTPAGDRVFQTDWDDFTRLFFYNTHNTYTLGLDPTYMELYDPELYAVWVDVSQGDVERLAQTIRETFGASYILTDLNHKDFLRQAKKDPGLSEVYRDEYAVIFQVVAAKAAGGKEADTLEKEQSRPE